MGVVAPERLGEGGEKRKRAFARGNFRSYKKSYHSAALRVRSPGSSISRAPGRPSSSIALRYASLFSWPLSLSPFFFSPAASLRALVAPSHRTKPSLEGTRDWLAAHVPSLPLRSSSPPLALFCLCSPDIIHL